MRDKVLIIEDAMSLSGAIKQQLQDQYRIESDIAATIEQATQLLTDKGDEYFIATVDLQLPDCDTGAAITLVNQHNIPSIVFTGQYDVSLREKFSTHDLVDYVFKAGPSSIYYVCWLIRRILLNHHMTILVVDDSRSAMATISRLLANQGFKVLQAYTGEECMREMENKPDLIILDQFLPDATGHDLCRKIRNQYPDPTIQVIGVSSKGDKDTAAFFLKNGGNDFLIRPFNPEEFCNRINHRADYVDQIRELKYINEEKNNFLGMAAHDLRNPLSIIQQASKHLQRVDITDEKKKSLTEMIQKSANSMQQLLNDLLDISAIENSNLKMHKLTINLSEIVKERIEYFKPKAQVKNIEIEAMLPDSTMLELDPTRITQVIDNLISNAVKYSPELFQINISIEKHTDYVRVNVFDQGPGINEQDVPKLFKAFNRLGHHTTGGESSHGLGLSICLRIIQAHNGKIGYQDNPDGGSHFYFDLPK